MQQVLFFAACSNGHFSKISLSFLINFKKFEFATKKPPLIQLLVVCGFSLNEITLFFLSNISPNLAGGLTAVTVMSFFISMKLNKII